MPRHPRLFLPGATYHVYCRVPRGEFVFDDADRHPDAITFDGLWPAEERAELELGEFAARFEAASGNALDDLASRFRSPEQVRGRIEFSTLAAGRYGLRVRDIAALINKHRNSITKWLNIGLRREGTDPEFKRRLDDLDAAISSGD